MQCLNIKNKEVEALLKEYTDILGSYNAAYYVLSENNGYGLDKAPNGEPSKLFTDLLSHHNGDSKLAIQAKAKTFANSFKTWFKDSKVVDGNGEPLIVWHGTEHSFDTFEVDVNNERGKHLFHNKNSFFFTTTKEKAFKYKRANTMPVYLSLQNPGIHKVEENTTVNNLSKENEILEDTSYDSAIFERFDKEGDNDGKTPTVQYVAKTPNQIKSIDNQGTFSQQSNSIYKQEELKEDGISIRLDEEVENVANMMLNKLSIKSSKYRPRSKKNNQTPSSGEEYAIEKLIRTYTEITGLTLDISDAKTISDVIEILKFELHNNFKDRLAKKYKELTINGKVTSPFSKARYNTISSFLNYGEVDALSRYSDFDASFIKLALPSLFKENKFKTTKAAFDFYKRELQNPSSILNKKINKSTEEANLEYYISAAITKKAETISLFTDLVSDYAFRIEKKVLSETRRAIEFADYKRREDDKKALDVVVDDLTKHHRLATFINDQTDDKLETDLGEKYFPTRNIYPIGSSTSISESTTLEIVNKIIQYGGPYAEYAKSILKYVKNNNTKVVLMSEMGAAGNTHYKFDNSKGYTQITEAVVNINYDSKSFKSDPDRLLLHEITHSLSSLAIAGNEDMKNAIQSYIDYCTTYLAKNSKVSRMMGFDSVYGFSNPSEFIADFFTFKEFQDLLKQIPASDNTKFKNIFEQILDTILEWFIGPKNAYEQFLPVAIKLLEIQDELIPDIPGLSEITDNQNTVQKIDNDPSDDIVPTERDLAAADLLSMRFNLSLREETDTKSFLQDLLNKNYIPKHLIPLAKLFLKKNTLGKMMFGIGENAYGTYDSTTTDIAINAEIAANNEDLVSTILHELVHRYTTQPFFNKAASGIEGNVFSESITKIFNDFKSANQGSKLYGYTSPTEFMAEFMTNKEFQDHLKTILYPNEKTTFWQKVINAMYKFFGVTSRMVSTKKAFLEVVTTDIILNRIGSTTEQFVQQAKLPYDSTPNPFIYKKAEQASSSVDQTKITGIKRIDDVYNKLVPRMEARLKDIQNFKTLDVERIEKMKVLIAQLNNLEAYKQILSVIPDMSADIRSAMKRMNNMSKAVEQAEIKGTPYDVDTEQLLQIKRSFLGFYGEIVKGMHDMLKDTKSLEYLAEQGISENDIEAYKNDLRSIQSDFYSVERNYTELVRYQTRKMLLDYAKANGSTTAQQLADNIDLVTEDIGSLSLYTMSPVHLNDEMLNAMANITVNAQNAVKRDVLAKGKELISKTVGVTKAEIDAMYELDKHGKATGNVVRKLNYGQMRKDYEDFRTSLAIKYNLASIYDTPTDVGDRTEYNKSLNDWLSSHTERKFTSDYYAIFNKLSDDAKRAKSEIDLELNYYYSKATDKKGVLHKELLNDKDWLTVRSLLYRKRNLGNRYDMFGNAKVGLEKQISDEIRSMNEELSDNIDYTTNMKRFKEAFDKAKRELKGKLNSSGKDLFKVWKERNMVVRIKSKFFESIAGAYEEIDDAEYKELKSKRNDLKKLYKDENGNVNPTELPESVRKEWIVIETSMKEIESERRGDAKNETFNQVATIVTDENYFIEQEQAEALGEDAYFEWVKQNHVYVEGRSTPQVASFWTRIMPKDESMWEAVPTTDWNEVSDTSFYRNDKWSEAEGEFMIPKKELYDNTKAYDKSRKNPKAAALMDAVVALNEESNDNLAFAKHVNKYQIAQIEEGIWRYAMRQKGLFNKFKTLNNLFWQRGLSIRQEDTDYVDQTTRRADGSELKLVPTRFIKRLDKTDEITRDLVGASLAYYNMARNHKEMLSKSSDLEIIAEQMKLRRFKEDSTGVETNKYKRAIQLIDNHIYGITKKRNEFTVAGKKVSLNKVAFGLSDYIRKVNIAHSPFVILTGYVTNLINTRIEALSGIYFDKTSMWLADKEMALNMFSAISSIGSLTHNNKIMGLLEYNQVVFDNYELLSRLNESKVARLFAQRFWYGGHTLVDYETKGRIALAVYFNYRLVDGKFIRFNEYKAIHPEMDKKKAKQEWLRIPTTLYDAYDMKNGKFDIKPEYKELIPTMLEDRVANTVRQIGSRIDGQLTDIDRASIHYHAVFHYLVMFRNFIIQMFQTRFKQRHFNYATGMEEEGYYRSVAHVLSEMFDATKNKQLIEFLKNEDNLTDFELGAVKKVAAEMMVLLIIFPILNAILSKAAEDDDDDFTLQALSYLSLRSSFEMRTPYNPLELLAMLNSPSAGLSWANNLLNIANVFSDPFGEVDRGAYEGMTKLERSFIRVSPFKNYVEMWDPKSKQMYLENQIMK